jgi:lipopolysaccharide transport system permease protein
MNLQAHRSNSLFSIFTSFKRNRRLIFEMTKREIRKKYQGSMIGLAWTFINPLLMLSVYTFVFSVVFKARWGVNANESRVDFAIILFAGLIVFGIFSEAMNQAPSLIVSNVNYVKKVIFPLEILSWVSLGSILFQAAISIGILLLVQLILKGYVPLTVFYFPIVILPLIFLSLGTSWFVASLGVFVRDIAQILTFFTTILLFTSAVFFPITALSERSQLILKLNPIAILIEESRKVLVYGQSPDWVSVGLLLAASSLFVYFGYWWFQKTRNGFADVL